MNHRNGFTLIEVIVILAVIAILASMAVPAALRLFEVTATSGTDAEMQNLRRAILGDPNKIENGVRTDFGYLGDMGCLPTPTTTGLTSLFTQGSFPAWAFNAATQIGSGWRGPYITGAATTTEFTQDQWGNDYVYTIAGACPLVATFTSNGANGAAGGGDDIDYSIVATDATSTVSGYLKDPSNNPIPNSTVTINYPGGGAGPGNLTSANATTDATGRYLFGVSVPFGKRSITFPATSPKLIVTSAVASTGTGGTFCGSAGASPCSYIEYVLTNFSSSNVTGINSVTASYTYGPPTIYYYKVVWATTTMEDCNAAGCSNTSDTSVTVSPAQTINAASTALPPVTFTVDSAQVQVPDIIIGKKGQIGTSVRVQLINWRDCSGTRTCGSSIPAATLTGITFTVTLSDGSTDTFTPQ